MRRLLISAVTVLIVGAGLSLGAWSVLYLGSKLDRLASALERLEDKGDSIETTMRIESASLQKTGKEVAEPVTVVGTALGYWTQQQRDK